jgi:hypothetical protein
VFAHICHGISRKSGIDGLGRQCIMLHDLNQFKLVHRFFWALYGSSVGNTAETQMVSFRLVSAIAGYLTQILCPTS